jgi:hypothetical protein
MCCVCDFDLDSVLETGCVQFVSAQSLHREKMTFEDNVDCD